MRVDPVRALRRDWPVRLIRHALPTLLFPHRLRGAGRLCRGPPVLCFRDRWTSSCGALASGATHVYGVATLVRQRSAGALEIEDAALYQALHRLERQRLVAAEWGVSDNNRRARFYELTAEGRKRLRTDAASWRRYAQAVAAVLKDA
jgi:PadR family transcriptional regulator PadR